MTLGISLGSRTLSPKERMRTSSQKLLSHLQPTRKFTKLMYRGKESTQKQTDTAEKRSFHNTTKSELSNLSSMLSAMVKVWTVNCEKTGASMESSHFV